MWSRGWDSPNLCRKQQKKDGDALDTEMCLALFTAPIELELRQKMGKYKGTNVLAKMLHFTLNSAIIDEIELYRKDRTKSQPIILLGKKTQNTLE